MLLFVLLVSTNVAMAHSRMISIINDEPQTAELIWAIFPHSGDEDCIRGGKELVPKERIRIEVPEEYSHSYLGVHSSAGLSYTTIGIARGVDSYTVSQIRKGMELEG